jgi:predicted Zn-dependent protease
LIPIGNIGNSEINYLKDSLGRYFKVKTSIGKKSQYTGIDEFLSEDIILARPFLDSLEKNYNVESFKKIIFITDSKLAPRLIPECKNTADSLKFLIRGFTSRIPGSYGIVSTYMLRKESTNNQHYKNLLIKTTRHEFGHLLGLHHCRNDNCLMTSGYDPIVFQNIDYFLCDTCRNILATQSK